MTLFDRVCTLSLGKAAKPRRGAPYAPPWALATAAASRWVMPDYSLAENQAKAYQAISWISSALQIVSNMVALQPFQVMKLEGERRVGIDNHPLELLLQNPNPLMSRYELFFATTAYRKLCGTAYWWLSKKEEDAQPDEIWIVPSNRIKPIPDGKMYIRGYEYDPGDGQHQVLPPWQIVQFKNWHPRNEFVGLSDLEAIAITAEADQKMSQWTANFFAEDNAKFPGVLAFEQMMPDTAWERLQKEFRVKHGGTRQSLRMMRGVGQGGVHWVQTNMSQKDMEFLEGRAFNREEIFGVMAPGLASMLAINTTEANSLTGKKTLVDMVVWPALVLMAEKINSELLPFYKDSEENLVGEFEDLRVVDRAMLLAEQDAYAKVHKIDEIRQKYYQAYPIGDERGDMLIAEIGKPPVPLPAGRSAEQQDNETEVGEDEGYKEERYTEIEQRKSQMQGSKMQGSLRDAEIGRWRRYAAKRNGTKAAQFNPEHLPGDVAEVIKARLKAATSAEEVTAAFAGPF